MTVRKSAALAVALGAVMSFGAAHAQELKFEHVLTFGCEGTGEGQFKYVEDFAFSKDGHLLATDAAHAWVQAFDKTTGKFVARFGGKGEKDEHLDKPEGIAVDPDGNIFIADYNTGFVKKYDTSYKWMLTFSEYGSEPGQNIKSEFMDIRDGKLYMPEAGNHRVDVFDLERQVPVRFRRSGHGAGQVQQPEARSSTAKASSTSPT